MNDKKNNLLKNNKFHEFFRVLSRNLKFHNLPVLLRLSCLSLIVSRSRASSPGRKYGIPSLNNLLKSKSLEIKKSILEV